jgi:hypothetical protein
MHSSNILRYGDLEWNKSELVFELDWNHCLEDSLTHLSGCTIKIFTHGLDGYGSGCKQFIRHYDTAPSLKHKNLTTRSTLDL